MEKGRPEEEEKKDAFINKGRDGPGVVRVGGSEVRDLRDEGEGIVKTKAKGAVVCGGIDGRAAGVKREDEEGKKAGVLMERKGVALKVEKGTADLGKRG